MNNAHNTLPAVEIETVRQLAALNGLDLTPARAAELAPFVQDILAADRELAALDLGALPAAGLPWAPFITLECEDASHDE